MPLISVCVCSQNWVLSIFTAFPSLTPQPVALGYDVFERRPRLAAWRGRVEAYLGTELWQEAHGPIFNILEQMAKKTLPIPQPEFQTNMLLRISKIP